MKDKKEFVSFLKDSHTFLEKSRGVVGRQKIIKSSSVEAKPQVEKVQWEDVTENEPDVSFVEKDGEIQLIRFKCSCGCTTSVQLVYDKIKTAPELN